MAKLPDTIKFTVDLEIEVEYGDLKIVEGNAVIEVISKGIIINGVKLKEKEEEPNL